MPSHRHLVVLLTLAIACGGGEESPDAPATAPAIVPMREDAADLAYRGIYDTTVVLGAGRYVAAEGAAGGASRLTVVLAPGPLAMGDMNGDGVDDAVALLEANAGGSGVVTYAALLTGTGGTVHNAATVPLGDRVEVREATIVEGELRVRLIEAGPDDPSCCPSHKVVRTFRLEGGTLRGVASEDRGGIHEHELDGVWRLLALDRGEPVPDSVLVTLRVMDGMAAGMSGCNRYRGEFALERGERSLAAGPFSGTRKLCPPGVMDVEARYLQALEGVESWEFVAGRLSLTYRQDDGLSSLIFAPAADTEPGRADLPAPSS